MAVRRAGKLIQLTKKEFFLLRLLVLNKDVALSKHFIAQQAWGDYTEKENNIVGVYIGYLRGKIDKGFATPLIHTVPGGSYMIKDTEDSTADHPLTT